jgi:uncharacterized membrane protein YidH (DUF202 family)
MTWGTIVVLVAPIGVLASFVLVALRRSFAWLVPLGLLIGGVGIARFYPFGLVDPGLSDVLVVTLSALAGTLLGGAPLAYVRWTLRVWASWRRARAL